MHESAYPGDARRGPIGLGGKTRAQRRIELERLGIWREGRELYIGIGSPGFEMLEAGELTFEELEAVLG